MMVYCSVLKLHYRSQPTFQHHWTMDSLVKEELDEVRHKIAATEAKLAQAEGKDEFILQN